MRQDAAREEIPELLLHALRQAMAIGVVRRCIQERLQMLVDHAATFSSSGKPIAAPVYRGVQGTPVVFAASVFGELRTLEGDAGARAVVRTDPRRVSTLAVDADMPFDVDTPDDYARLSGEQ